MAIDFSGSAITSNAIKVASTASCLPVKKSYELFSVIKFVLVHKEKFGNQGFFLFFFYPLSNIKAIFICDWLWGNLHIGTFKKNSTL